MIGHRFVEALEDSERFFLGAVARQPAAVRLHDPQRICIELVGRLETLAGILALAGKVENLAGVEILEYPIPVRPGQLVDGRDSTLRVARRRIAPMPTSGVAIRSVIGPRAACESCAQAAV